MLWLYLEAYEPLLRAFLSVVKILVSFLAAHRPGDFILSLLSAIGKFRILRQAYTHSFDAAFTTE